jgi:transposase
MLKNATDRAGVPLSADRGKWVCAATTSIRTGCSLPAARGAGAGRPPLAADPRDGRRGAPRAVPEFVRLYPKKGRPSIAPEKLLRAPLLQVLYSIRSERQLIEQLDYNLLFRWFVGLSMDDPFWDPTVFTKNRKRLLRGDIARAFFERVVAQAHAGQLLSAKHFTVDGTLIETWAGLKSLEPKGAPAEPPDDPGNPTGERCRNATHASTTDPEARLMRKGNQHEAKLSYQGHVLMENRHGLVVDACLIQASGLAERETALAMATNVPPGAKLGRCPRRLGLPISGTRTTAPSLP